MSQGFIARRGPVGSAATYLFMILFSLVILFPFMIMLLSALKTNEEIFAAPEDYSWLPQPPRWSNFVTIREQVPEIGRYFLNSLIIAMGSTLLAVAVAIPAAYAVARLRFPGRRAFMHLVLITQMFSPIVIIVGVYKLFASADLSPLYATIRGAGLGWLLPGSPAGSLVDNLFGLILLNAAFNLAFAVWLLAGYLRSIPVAIEEAACVDGCSWWRILTSVLLPLAAPGIATAVIFAFIAAWNEFLFALTLLRTPEKRPVIVGLFSLIGQFEVQWNYVMAGALLAILPVVLLFWSAEKHLVGGLTAGAGK